MSICESIKKKYIRLSKGQRKVAQFVMDNPNIIATQVASEVGRQAGVSESTVIRFCYAMDLSGFSELQQLVKDFLIEKDGATSIAPKKHTIKKQNIPCYDSMSQDIDRILQTIQQIDETQFNQAMNMLHNAERIFILGFRSSAPTAFWMYHNLQMLRQDVHFMHYDATKIGSDLIQMNSQSVMFLVGFNEQQEDVMAVVELAKRKNVKIIAVTDHTPCPVQEYADILLVLDQNEQSFCQGDVAAISMLQALVEGMISLNKEHYEALRSANIANSSNVLDRLIESV
ncbi:MurR/RpiR family transcriptional regulator [Lysinibacillus sp. 54212]|uniref:MurR/RpiR family transcriptional regulator n=1 Tax=Lysinibacillus sp. 54212 TaxID=3119829 RepID=UPI002FC9A25B